MYRRGNIYADEYEYKERVDTKMIEQNGKYKLVCKNAQDLSTDKVLKSLHLMQAELVDKCSNIDVNNIVCYMTPTVKENIVCASKKLKMFGKKRPIVARFDEFFNRLPDTISLDVAEGIELNIVDPQEAEYDMYYLALQAIEKDDDTLWDLPF